MTVDHSGHVYVADAGKNRIQKFASDVTYLTQWGTAGGGNGQFETPYDIAVDRDGNVRVVDQGNNRVQVFDAGGAYLTQWGNHGAGDGQFDNPAGITTDDDGNVYVPDWGNNRIKKFGPLPTVAATKSWGQVKVEHR